MEDIGPPCDPASHRCGGITPVPPEDCHTWISLVHGPQNHAWADPPSLQPFPADTIRWINVGLSLVQRRRQWTRVQPTLIQRLVSVGLQRWIIFQFEIIINVLVSSFRFIWIPMSSVYDHYKYSNSFSAGTVFICQNLTSTGVRFWRIKTTPRWKGRSRTHPPLPLPLQRRQTQSPV